MNIDQIAMCNISIDLSQQALQTNEKLISNKLAIEISAKNRKFWRKTEKYSKE